MVVTVRNAEGVVTESDKEYAAKKLGRLDRYFHQAQRAELVHRSEKLGHHIEITVFTDGMTIRGEEHDASLPAAIDRVYEKLESRLKKFKGRLLDRHRRNGQHAPKALELEPDFEAEEKPRYVKVAEYKHFMLKPMSREEASLQMEMIDLPFFVFKNEENGIFEVLYRRKDGKYGVIQPEG